MALYDLVTLRQELLNTVDASEAQILLLRLRNEISNIKIKKEVVNNYYQQKGNEIKNSNSKQIDSLLQLRYNF
jgi:hypothetical protein